MISAASTPAEVKCWHIKSLASVRQVVAKGASAAIDRSGENWDKTPAMIRSFALAMVRAAAAAPASYYYPGEAETS
jgi:hypothetical protein